MQNRLVLHVLPSAVARGAQIYARALADWLEDPSTRHELLCLFDGPEEVRMEHSLRLRRPRLLAPLDPRLALRVHKALVRLSPAVVVAHGGDALKCVAPGLWRRGVPIVYCAIGTFGAAVHRPARALLWRVLVASAQVVVAVSDDVAAECRELVAVPDERLVVIPNGRDAHQFRPGRDRSRSDGVPAVGFAGQLTPGKRPDWFIAVVEALRAQGVQLRALLAGSGPLGSSLASRARSAQVEMLGLTTDVAALMRDLDLLLFTSLPEGEGMPGVLIEAGLSGVPAIATAVPGVRSVVTDGVTGIVVGVDSFDDMVAATRSLLHDRTRRVTMGRAARQRCAEHFSLEASGERWVELIDALTRANDRGVELPKR